MFPAPGASLAMVGFGLQSFGARTYLTIGLLVWLAWVAVRAYVRGTRPVVSVAILLVLLIPALWTEVRWLRVQSAATATVQQLTGNRDAGVQCQRALATFLWAGADLGRVEWDQPDRAWLTLETCQHLGSWYRSDRTAPTLDEAIAVHVLTHEAMHVDGERDEAVTECRALQSDARTVVLLGARPSRDRHSPGGSCARSTQRCPTSTARRSAAPEAPWTSPPTTAPGREPDARVDDRVRTRQVPSRPRPVTPAGAVVSTSCPSPSPSSQGPPSGGWRPPS